MLAPLFTLRGETLALLVMAYGFAASVLPVWLLLAPRDYLSAFVKIGVVLVLALGIVVVLPPLQIPAVTRFVDGTGPVFGGKLFPFAFVKIDVVLALALGLVVVLPPLQRPAVARFVDGPGPVFAGKLFPFVFVTIACGAISRFHALVASGTTPKLREREPDARLGGY